MIMIQFVFQNYSFSFKGNQNILKVDLPHIEPLHPLPFVPQGFSEMIASD